MRKKILIPVTLLLLIAAGLLFWPKKQTPGTKKTPQTKTENTGNQTKKTEPVSNEQEITPTKQVTTIPEKNYTFILEPPEKTSVRFPFSGRLETGKKRKPGDRFLKNELLFQLNNSSLFTEISRRKTELKSKLEKLYGQIAQEVSEAYPKWQAYGEAITETDLLPGLPGNLSSRERALIDQAGISALSLQIQQKEQEMFAYFYLAPFDGRVQAVKIREGQRVAANQVVAVIYKEETVLLERKIHQKDLQQFAGKQKFKMENAAGSEWLTLHFKTGKPSGDSVLISAKIPAGKLNLFDFYETVKISR